MALRQSADPEGYKKLLVYKKAEELQGECARLTAQFPREKTLIALADQMDRSARSVKQNIVEGWMRNSTKEYYEFLGFSIGANAELEEDCDDIIKGVYKGLSARGGSAFGGKGMEGELKGEEVARLRFYSLDTKLPLVVQLKLRCKELKLLFSKLQKSLEEKMVEEHRLSGADRLAAGREKRRSGGRWCWRAPEGERVGRLADGEIVSKEEKGD